MNVVKATQAAATLGTTGLTDYGPSLGLLMDQFKSSAFDTIAGSAFKVDDFVGRVAVSSTVSSAKVSEGSAKPVQRWLMYAQDFDPVKIIAQVAISDFLVDGLGSAGLTALGRELKSSVALGTDTEFLSSLSGNTAAAVGGDAWSSFLPDLEILLNQVNLATGSKPYFIVAPELAKAIAIRALSGGIEFSWNKGTIAGIPVLISDAQTQERITLVDAATLAIKDSGISLRSSSVTNLEMSDAPSMTSGSSVSAQSTVSAFQAGMRVILAERSVAIKPTRAGSYAHLTAISLGESSPHY